MPPETTDSFDRELMEFQLAILWHRLRRNEFRFKPTDMITTIRRHARAQPLTSCGRSSEAFIQAAVELFLSPSFMPRFNNFVPLNFRLKSWDIPLADFDIRAFYRGLVAQLQVKCPDMTFDELDCPDPEFDQFHAKAETRRALAGSCADSLEPGVCPPAAS